MMRRHFLGTPLIAAMLGRFKPAHPATTPALTDKVVPPPMQPGLGRAVDLSKLPETGRLKLGTGYLLASKGQPEPRWPNGEPLL
jgi:hypothetical protein